MLHLSALQVEEDPIGIDLASLAYGAPYAHGIAGSSASSEAEDIGEQDSLTGVAPSPGTQAMRRLRGESAGSGVASNDSLTGLAPNPAKLCYTNSSSAGAVWAAHEDIRSPDRASTAAAAPTAQERENLELHSMISQLCSALNTTSDSAARR